MRYVRYTALSAIDASTVGAQASSPIDTNQAFSLSVQIVATGSPVGVCKLQASNDYISLSDPQVAVPTNWTDIPSATSSVSAAGATLIPKTDICYRWIQVVYTKTSGTGTITANVIALSI